MSLVDLSEMTGCISLISATTRENLMGTGTTQPRQSAWRQCVGVNGRFSTCGDTVWALMAGSQVVETGVSYLVTQKSGQAV